MKTKNYLIILFVVLFLEIIGEILFAIKGIPYVVYVFKPMLMPLLIVWYLKSVDQVLKILVYALIFSFFGDVFLMFLPLSEHFFLAGLASFLITHVLYTIIFVKHIEKNKNSILKKRPHLILPFLLYGASLLLFLYRTADSKFLEMQIPVIVYASVIMIMVIMAIARFERVKQKSFSWVLIGALLFMFSDTIIALNNFSNLFIDYKYVAKIFIMSFYVIGQYYITAGIVDEQKKLSH